MVVAEVEDNRVDLGEFPGALEGLVRLLNKGGAVKSGKSDILSNAAWALAHITVTREIRATVVALPGALQVPLNTSHYSSALDFRND